MPACTAIQALLSHKWLECSSLWHNAPIMSKLWERICVSMWSVVKWLLPRDEFQSAPNSINSLSCPWSGISKRVCCTQVTTGSFSHIVRLIRRWRSCCCRGKVMWHPPWKQSCAGAIHMTYSYSTFLHHLSRFLMRCFRWLLHVHSGKKFRYHHQGLPKFNAYCSLVLIMYMFLSSFLILLAPLFMLSGSLSLYYLALLSVISVTSCMFMFMDTWSKPSFADLNLFLLDFHMMMQLINRGDLKWILLSWHMNGTIPPDCRIMPRDTHWHHSWSVWDFGQASKFRKFSTR